MKLQKASLHARCSCYQSDLRQLPFPASAARHDADAKRERADQKYAWIATAISAYSTRTFNPASVPLLKELLSCTRRQFITRVGALAAVSGMAGRVVANTLNINGVRYGIRTR